MAQEEINLSKEIVTAGTLVPSQFVIPTMEVREFIAKIKQRIENIQHDCASLEVCRKDEVIKIINERAGDKLF